MTYSKIDLYKLNTYKCNNPKDGYNTYRKLKELPIYFYFDETYKGIKPVIFVLYDEEIYTYSINYNDAKTKGIDVILENKLDIFENTTYIYVYDDYNIAMDSFLSKKKDYLNASKQILIEQIKEIECEKTIKTIEERERLEQQVEQKLNELMDIYDHQLDLLNIKIKRIDERIENVQNIINLK